MADAQISPIPEMRSRQLIERSRSMIPGLRQRSSEATADCRIPEQTIQEMKEAGFFRLFQPSRYGGMESNPQIVFEIQMNLAEGCPSSAWVFGVIAAHALHLALFDPKAQDDVWKDNGDALLCSSYQPVGRIKRVAGGFHLSGRWEFASGCDHCDWALLGTLIPPDIKSGDPEIGTLLVPRADFRIEHDWNVFGLQATGSHSIVMEGAFVPEHRTHRAMDTFSGRNPGSVVNTAPLYALPWAQIFARTVSTSAIGALQGALDAFKGIAAKRVSTHTGRATKLDPRVLEAAASTQSAIAEMKLVLWHSFDVMLASVRSGTEIPVEDRLRYRFEASRVVRHCAHLCDELMSLVGSRALYADSPLVRYWLDINAARAHVGNDPALIGSRVGALIFGEKTHEAFIVG